ncbi:MAG: hypothetical protein U0235_34010 [Polyangiaceae bacterium]
MRTLLVTTLLLLVGCFSKDESSPTGAGTDAGASDGGLVPLRGALTDGKTKAPLGDSLVFVEVHGLYNKNPDTTKAHPDYLYATATKPDGTFEVMTPPGLTGLHTFQNGYRYGSHRVEDAVAGAGTFDVEPLLPADVKPVPSDFKVEPTKVAPGGSLKFSVTMKASSDKDPISEEVLIAELSNQWARALDPPPGGVPGKSADGVWSRTVTAPTKPGKYTYILAVSSELCITSDKVSLDVTVE